MSIEQIDKKQLKQLIKEVLEEDPTLLKEVITELLAKKAQQKKQEQIAEILEQELETYDEVFKALA